MFSSASLLGVGQNLGMFQGSAIFQLPDTTWVDYLTSWSLSQL